MRINIVNSEDMINKNAWSFDFLFPQEEIKVIEGYSLIKLAELVDERWEMITPAVDCDEVHYVGLENIEPRTGRLVGFSVKQGSDIKSNCKVFRNGDILYGRLRPNLNKVFYNDVLEKGVCSTEIIVLTPKMELADPIYLAELLRSEHINKRIMHMVKGAALPRVSMADFGQLQLPVPPLCEQRRISEVIMQKRAELEKHIKRAGQIPIELSEMLSASFA